MRDPTARAAPRWLAWALFVFWLALVVQFSVEVSDLGKAAPSRPAAPALQP